MCRIICIFVDTDLDLEKNSDSKEWKEEEVVNFLHVETDFCPDSYLRTHSIMIE